MTRYAQMFEQRLQPVKGFYELSALTKIARLSDEILNSDTDVPSGRVASLHEDTGRWKFGGDGTDMPCFLWNNKAQAVNDGTSSVTNVVRWYGVGPSGEMTGLVATGGFEVQTTEFDKTKTYKSNQLLTAATGTGTAAGLLTNASVTQYRTWVCGVTSWHENAPAEAIPAPASNAMTGGGPVGVNAHNLAVLTLWTYFLPAASA